MTIADRIRQHDKDVTAAVSKRYANCCPVCRNASRIRRHEIRRRSFYCQSDTGEPSAIRSWLVRWKCCECRRIFTDYPPFAVRFKRHVKPVIFKMVGTLLNCSGVTYRGITGDQTSHSSLWRWINWINTLCDDAQACIQWIMQDNPNSLIHRAPCGVDPRQARSSARTTMLEIARQTLHRITTFEHIVATRFSPS